MDTPTKAPAPSKLLLLQFARAWEARFKAPYVIAWGKEGAQVARLLKSHSAEALGAYIDFWFSAFVDDFAKKCGYSLGAFVALLPRVVVAAQDAATKNRRGIAGSSEADVRRAAQVAETAAGLLDAYEARPPKEGA